MAARDSLPYFTLAAVAFESSTEAQLCQTTIAKLRESERLPPRYEFHFAAIPAVQRRTFLGAVADQKFFFAACHVQKGRLSGRMWRDKGYFYTKVIAAVVSGLEEMMQIAQACKSRPLNAKVTADNSSDPAYFAALRREFRKPKSEAGRSLVEVVRPGRSHSSDLLQLADMVCGAVRHSFEESGEYLSIIAGKEVRLHCLPE